MTERALGKPINITINHDEEAIAVAHLVGQHDQRQERIGERVAAQRFHDHIVGGTHDHPGPGEIDVVSVRARLTDHESAADLMVVIGFEQGCVLVEPLTDAAMPTRYLA